jgi:hypothetical protein
MAATMNDFDAAKAIGAHLEGMDKERQHKILRWVAESLDLVLHVKTAPAHDLADGSGARSGVPEEPSRQSERIKDIKAFVESKQPKSDVQFAAVVAYYFRFGAAPHERKETIGPDILQDATRLCGRERFLSPKGTLNNAKNLGYLDSPARGQFQINSVGENLVAMTLPGSGSERSQIKKKKRLRRRETRKPSATKR